MSTYSFPSDFLWDAATSADPVEGSPLADGAGPSLKAIDAVRAHSARFYSSVISSRGDALGSAD